MHATGVAAALEVKGLRLVDNELHCPRPHASNNVRLPYVRRLGLLL